VGVGIAGVWLVLISLAMDGVLGRGRLRYGIHPAATGHKADAAASGFDQHGPNSKLFKLSSSNRFCVSAATEKRPLCCGAVPYVASITEIEAVSVR
jgi:hypothetical protein